MLYFTLTNPPAGISHRHVFNQRTEFKNWYDNQLRPLLGNPVFDNNTLTFNGGSGQLVEDGESVGGPAEAIVDNKEAVAVHETKTVTSIPHTKAVIVPEEKSGKKTEATKASAKGEPKKSVIKKITEKLTRKKPSKK